MQLQLPTMSDMQENSGDKSLQAVTVDSVNPDGMQFSDFSTSSSKVVLSLRMTNRHLKEWAKTKSSNSEMSFVCQLNQCVDGNVVKVDEQCARIEKCLSGKARKIKVDLKKSSGKTYQKILEQPYNLFVLDGELESFEKITEERDMALLRAAEWREAVQQHKAELGNLLEEMARDTVTFLDELELQSAQIAELSEREGVNKGKKIDEVSPRQARQKVAHVTTLSKQALWFAHSFGLEPEFVQFRKVATGSSLAVHLSDDPRSDDTPPQPTEDDKEHILQVLYLLDKFAVSDELYHELRMLCPHLPASNRVKQARREINELLEYTRLSPPYPGAYRSFKATLVEKISKAVSNFTSFSLGFIGGEG